MKPRKRNIVSRTMMILAISVGGCTYLPLEESVVEKNYTVYVDLGAQAQNALEAVEAGDIMATATPSPTPTPTPTPVPTKAAEKPKPRATADDEVSADEALRLFDQVNATMQQRGILPDDVNSGATRLQTIRKYIDSQDYKLAEGLIRSFVNDLNALRIDEVFITKKNARLLGLIQEKAPTPEVQSKIDAASEEINQLLEKANFIEINRRLNGLFEMVGP